VAAEERFVDIVRRGEGVFADVADAGNEFAEGIFRLLGGIAEDLNADGTVDILAVTASAKTGNVFLMNRGYGSYMRREKERQDLLPGAMSGVGALGGAAVDVDADGDTDVVLASADGVLRLCRNLTWDSRRFVAGKGATRQARALAGTRAVHVRVTGARGVVGADVALADGKGRIHARRWIGAEMFTGCRGADAYTLVVREAGTYTLTVRYSDGVVKRQKVDLAGKGRLVRVTVRR
jgi:hypothetical protein